MGGDTKFIAAQNATQKRKSLIHANQGFAVHAEKHMQTGGAKQPLHISSMSKALIPYHTTRNKNMLPIQQKSYDRCFIYSSKNCVAEICRKTRIQTWDHHGFTYFLSCHRMESSCAYHYHSRWIIIGQENLDKRKCYSA